MLHEGRMTSTSDTHLTTRLDVQGRDLEPCYSRQAREFPYPLEPSDYGNMKRLRARYAHALRWVPEQKAWIVFDGSHWQWDPHGFTVQMMAQETIEYAIRREWQMTENGDDAKSLDKWAKKSHNKTPIDRMVKLVKAHVAMPLADLDPDPYLLGVGNGTLDLRTGELREPRRDDWITRPLDVEYDPEAEAPAWASFLETVQPDAEVRRYLQRCAGYTLTGSIEEQAVFILYGDGSNGKSSFLRAVHNVLGPMARTTPDTTFMGRSNRHPEALADLVGARQVLVTESGEGTSTLREGVIKSVSGGENVSARAMYGKRFEYAPAFKVWLAVNELPTVRGSNKGIWRRLVPIPFDVTIGAADADRDLPRKLREEAPGILAWLVRGCLDWQDHKGLSDTLAQPQRVVQATATYRQDMDHVGRFLEDACERPGPDEDTPHVASADLYEVARLWYRDEGLASALPSKPHFGRKLKKHGVTSVTKRIERRRTRCRVGVRIRPEWLDALDKERDGFAF